MLVLRRNFSLFISKANPNKITEELRELIESGYLPTPSHWSLLIRAYGASLMLREAKQLYKDTTLYYRHHPSRRKMGVDRIYGAMMTLYARKPVDTQRIFDTLIKDGYIPDSKKAHLLIRSYAISKNIDGALGALELCKQKFGIEITVQTYNILMRCSDPRKAMQLYNDMIDDGVKPTIETFTILLKVHASSSNVHDFLVIHQNLLFMGVKPDIVYYTVLIDHYLARKETKAAIKFVNEVVDSGLEADIIFYNTIIKWLAKLNDIDAVEQSLNALLAQKISPDCRTFNAVVNAYMKAGMIDTALCWFETFSQRILPADAPAIHFSFQNAFPIPLEPDITIYTAIINGYGRAERIEEATECYEKLGEVGLSPTIQTFTSLIHWTFQACNHQQASILFKENKYGLKYDLALYNCMLAGYSKCGLFEKMLRMLKQLPFQASEATFQVLMKALITRGDVYKAMEVYDWMAINNVQANELTYSSLLRNLCHRRPNKSALRSDVVVKLDISLIEKKSMFDTFVYRSVCRVYKDFRNDKDRLYPPPEQFKHLGQPIILASSQLLPRIQLFDAVCAFHIKNNDLESAFKVLEEMVRMGVAPDAHILLRFTKWYSLRVFWHESCLRLNQLWKLCKGLSNEMELRKLFIGAAIATYGRSCMDSRHLNLLESTGTPPVMKEMLLFVANCVNYEMPGRYAIHPSLYTNSGVYDYWDGVKQLLQITSFICKSKVSMARTIKNKIPDNLNSALLPSCLPIGGFEQVPEVKSQLHRGKRVELGTSAHYLFLYFIVRHCELHELWDAKKLILESYKLHESWDMEDYRQLYQFFE